ncbi:sensor histidine kinase [Palleronia pelagia]|uniref:histidine kinase n=1 Tax=Palleronia pelagia TaxID=387096 RepID=A0A1H8MGX8_9RHOB|nr:sensor histidine kinase [Palleronia pelagia]SEO16569.1 Two-component sensor histidine kinase, contains HisKA and HATPase domains [Palleronia pelagia]
MEEHERPDASAGTEQVAGPQRHVLIRAPFGQDANALWSVFSDAGIRATCLDSPEDLRASLGPELGALVLSGEALTPDIVETISEAARTQDQWSSIPILVLLTHPDRPPAAYSILEAIGPAATLIALRRPAPPNSILSAVRTLLAVRDRQATIERQIGEIEDKRADLRFLLDELDHRVRNTLAKIHGISRMTARQSADLAEFQDVFGARITALAEAHDLLSIGRDRPADLMAVAEGALAPFRDPSGENVRIDGPEVRLWGGSALTFGLFLHELATNASKHGALSSPSGRVTVEWDIGGAPDTPCLALDWTERGGPLVEQPRQHSFGWSLIQEITPAELGGEVEIDFPPEGLRCRLTCPLPR